MAGYGTFLKYALIFSGFIFLLFKVIHLCHSKLLNKNKLFEFCIYNFLAYTPQLDLVFIFIYKKTFKNQKIYI